MRRYLVVANQTLSSQELVDELTSRAAEEESTFHLLVPPTHGEGLTWTERHDRELAKEHLDEAIDRFAAAGLTVTGEVGHDSPVASVDDLLRRDHHADAYDEVIVSTLPVTLSRWLKMDAPSRIQRLTTLPVHHVIGHPATAMSANR